MKVSLSSNSLKIIAIIAMVLDHLAYSFVSITSPFYYVLRIIGRITAPIMFFGIANGYFYTKNKFKYGVRLLCLAIISQIPYSLFIDNKLFLFDNYNVVFTMLLGFLCLCVLYGLKNLFFKSILIFIFTILVCFCEYGMFGMVLILMFALCKENRWKLLLYSLISVVYITYKTILYYSIFIFIINIGLFLAIPLFNLYNDKKGKYNFKYLFYVFYPIQFLAIFFIKMCFC